MAPTPTFGGRFAPPVGARGSFPDAPQPGGERAPEAHDADLRGPKNLLLELRRARVEGVASSASQAYREGLGSIDESSRLELSNVTQAAAPTVNNGVVVRLDAESSWLVTGTCYLTGLELAPHAILKGHGGRALRMEVDGAETPVEAGSYRGRIVLRLV